MYRLFSIFIFTALLIPTAVGAATFSGSEMYSLGSGEIVSDNLYVGGGDVTVGGSVEGDAFIGGGSVTFSGTVRDDIAIGGGNVTTLGSVGGDARIGGGNLVIGGPIGGELIAGGGTVKVLSNTTVGADLVLAGGAVTFAGIAGGDARFAGGQVVIDGTIRGDVIVDVDDTLVLGNNARIDGSLVYRGARADMLEQQSGAIVNGSVTFEEYAPIANRGKFAAGLAAVFGLLFLGKILATLIAALGAVLIFKKFSGAVVRSGFERWGMHILRGFIVLVVVPIIAILLFISLVGALVGALVLLSYIVLLMVAAVYSGILFGSWLFRIVTKSDVEVTWQQAVIGTILLAIVQLIPIIGWVIGLAFFLMALGAVSYTVYRKVWLER